MTSEAVFLRGGMFRGGVLPVTELAKILIQLDEGEFAPPFFVTGWAAWFMAGNASFCPGHLGGDRPVQVSGSGQGLMALAIQAGTGHGRAGCQQDREENTTQADGRD